MLALKLLIAALLLHFTKPRISFPTWMSLQRLPPSFLRLPSFRVPQPRNLIQPFYYFVPSTSNPSYAKGIGLDPFGILMIALLSVASILDSCLLARSMTVSTLERDHILDYWFHACGFGVLGPGRLGSPVNRLPYYLRILRW